MGYVNPDRLRVPWEKVTTTRASMGDFTIQTYLHVHIKAGLLYGKVSTARVTKGHADN